ncbi:hypothetical protein [Streptomyces sp. NPDC020951]|uniref:hypothetical protein n=1 Tax=Streptomyces sp. NPDC020951 TaxID=3365104 RepID=UPI0037A3C6F3
MNTDVAHRIAQLGNRLGLGVVAVVGAGLSLSARYPTSAGLAALLWDAVDADPAARADLAAELGKADMPTKLLVGDNGDHWDPAWRTVEGSPAARQRFQQEMANLDRHRSAQPSAAHEALAALIHAGVVECVVSLNWDTALESAYRRQYGTGIPDGILFKPHGDAADPQQPWMLPHLPGTLGPDLRDRIRSLVADHPRTLLIVGYSERDTVVVDHLIAPLDQGWRVCRMGPDVSGSDDIPAVADTALPALANGTRQREATSAWHTVPFSGRHDISHALAGERLGPSDVEACPRLPEVALLVDALRRDHAVVLNGDSGCGKSISAYQALSDLLENGYEVLRLRDDARKRGLRQWMADLSLYPHRKALLVDDAQDLPADLVRELAETATADQLVLVVGVDHVAGGVTTYRISNIAAIGALARDMQGRADEILPKIRALDDFVGNLAGDELLMNRIEEASTKDSAWLFFYTLTGGWRRTERDALDLRGHDRADLLLLALAIAQIAGVDAGVTTDSLAPYARQLGRDRAWIDRSLAILRDKRLITRNDGVLRCAHLRSAWALIKWMLHPPRYSHTPPQPVTIPPIASAAETPAPPLPPPIRRTERPRAVLPDHHVEADRKTAAAFFRLTLDSPHTPLRGAAWLIGRNHDSESRWVLNQYDVLHLPRIHALSERALATPAGPDAAMAAQLLENLLSPYEDDCLDLIRDHHGRVLEWVRGITPENGWAIGDLINALANDDRAFTENLLADVDPHALARLIPDGGWPHVYSTTRAVDRITQAAGMPLTTRVGHAYDPEAFQALAANPPADIHAVDELLSVLAYTQRDLGLEVFNQLTPHLATAISRNPPIESQKMFRTWAFLLGFAPHFLRGRHVPDPAARRLAKKFVRTLDADRFARTLSHPAADLTWENFCGFVEAMKEIDPTSVKTIVSRIDVAELAAEFEQSLPTPSRCHLYAVEVLREHRPDEAQELLERFEARYAAIDIFLASMAPKMTIRLLRRGLPLDLGLRSHDWEIAATVVDSIAAHDPQTASELAEANRPGFIAGLSSKSTDPFEDLSAWIRASDKHAPGLVDEVLRQLPADAVTAWASELRKKDRKREIARLVHRAAASDGPAAAEAHELIRRFPSLQRQRKEPSP